ncbi:MAG TPA: NAD(P)H-dependent oxidoreductase subunit E [Dehalococcoidia bacterium]|nr:NAD(P)H-dependent oxidoreductase subunit E [Dehalococcoidia bacterium]
MVISNDIDLSLLDPVLEKYQFEEGALIPILQETQQVYGYLPEEVLVHLSREVRVPLSQIYAVVTFYSQFYLTPRGRNIIRVCRGTACYVRGGRSVLRTVEGFLGIREGNTTADYKFTLETVACLGACAMGPVVVINGKYFGKMTSTRAKIVLKAI